jgi:hypothetical protein
MLRFLLDENISPDVADGLRAKHRSVPVVTMTDWENGRYLSESDEVIVPAVVEQGLVLVTYGLATIPPLLKEMAERGKAFPGVVFIDHKTIPSNDFGQIIRSLAKLWAKAKDWDWENRVYHLERE